jgi:hypothetical protein
MSVEQEDCTNGIEAFYSFDAGNTKSEIHITKTIYDEHIPSGCLVVKGMDGEWLQPTQISIEEWVKYFVQIMGYGDAKHLESKDITYFLDMEKKEIQFKGPFGYLNLDSKGNFICDFNP